MKIIFPVDGKLDEDGKQRLYEAFRSKKSLIKVHLSVISYQLLEDVDVSIHF